MNEISLHKHCLLLSEELLMIDCIQTLFVYSMSMHFYIYVGVSRTTVPCRVFLLDNNRQKIDVYALEYLLDQVSTDFLFLFPMSLITDWKILCLKVGRESNPTDEFSHWVLCAALKT